MAVQIGDVSADAIRGAKTTRGPVHEPRPVFLGSQAPGVSALVSWNSLSAMYA